MPIFRAIVPANPMPSEVAVDDPYRGAAYIGDVGRTESMLRPAGKARFGSLLVDVVTQGDMIAAGTAVEVVERRGNRVVVRPVRIT
jgi:membrane-bound ClpP family serine protease